MKQPDNTTANSDSRSQDGVMQRAALAVTEWSERWFPDAFVFTALAVLVVAVGALTIGASPKVVMVSFGTGFWSLINFTMQMAIIVIIGYVVATSPPAARLIDALAAVPRTGRGAIAYVALISMVTSLLNWALSLVFAGLLVRSLARRRDLRMDYRAAGAAAYLGLGSVWALGISSSAAQLQANAASLPKSILAITGVIPFSETIFTWQSILLASILLLVSLLIAYLSAPSESRALGAGDMGVDVSAESDALPARQRPGEWLEYSPILSVLIAVLGIGWLWNEFSSKSFILGISNLNSYNFLFFMLGLLLHWRPRRFLNAVVKAVPATSGILVQFPLYGGIAALLTEAKNIDGFSLSHYVASWFVGIASTDTFPVLAGIYSAVLGFFVPSGGGKWVIEAPYVMQAAIDLKVHLGWTVQIYNAAEALPNLINPFWMLPLLGVLGLKARDLVGYTFTQFVIHVPVVLFLLWILAPTFVYHPPVMP
ncbi:MAG: short-chain fatty acid transporter [Burkholderiales bacterium]